MKIRVTNVLIYFVISSSLVGATTVAQEKRDDDLMIEEVMVTAQRRSENLREVPIAISVFSADMIDNSGVKELRDLSEYIPNVYIDQGADISAQIRIRGVGAGEDNIGFDSRVGVYLDGVYLGQSAALNQDLVDLDHIEVLRGPQGTLFGKNTIMGYQHDFCKTRF
jgi:iron complex outermembrane receptor protein